MVYGRYLAQTKPAARIAVLYQDDEDGRDLLNGLRQGLGANAATIAKAVAVEPTTPNVDAEVAELRATRASVLAVFCFGRLFVQALVETKELGWRPTIVGNAVSSSPNVMQLATSAASGQQTIGTISVVFAKDPSDPAWRSDPGMKLFRQVLRQFVPGGNRADGFLIAGMASAFTFVDTLRKAGTDLTRAGLVRAAARLNEANNPFLLPGIVVRTGGNDRFPIEQMQLQRWNGKRWIRFGGLVTVG
jgi:ABC-type branched-subunit amino acid transport system substrate-binding protein